MYQRGLKYLRKALNNDSALFRSGQWESIEQILGKKRILVVERTGWGKSMVYFLAVKLMRENGAGPALLISPLLSLMRNQVESAERIGINARTINSTNSEDWKSVKQELLDNEVDILLISPERLANESFRQDILSYIAKNIGLFVIDEAHCISDWGHDFRPDYRRIVRILQAIPSNVPVLATTATANNRVVEDIKLQLGKNLIIQRGSLVRKSLKLQNINIPSPAGRFAWLAENLPAITGSGIIYTLTKPDAERVAAWLMKNKISASTYHSGVMPEDALIPELCKFGKIGMDKLNCLTENKRNKLLSTLYKEYLEQQLLKNNIKVLVATVALGMGFDKPDLGFVIHFQRPSSVVHYYQQIGRAGRSVDEAYGILLCGEEDDRIADYFIKQAFPPQKHISDILTALDAADNGLSVPEIQKVLNLGKKQIEKTLKFLTVDSPSPVIKIKSKWQVTHSAFSYRIDQEHIDSIIGIRRAEQSQMQEYMHHSGCLMGFLQSALDDPEPVECGQCRNCNPGLLLSEKIDKTLANQAGIFLKRSYQTVMPRKRWPAFNMFTHFPFKGSNIPSDLQADEGRALSLWRDEGWGQMVADGKCGTGCFADELVYACMNMLKVWNPRPFPEWVTCIPSLNHPALVPDFAVKLADALELPFIPCMVKVIKNRHQKEMENSYQQAKNLDGVFEITSECRKGECLLIDDMVDSRWTFTIASALLRQAGCSAVYPLALTLNSPRMD
jgi:ATP-dependent DNA helicase RecQ